MVIDVFIDVFILIKFIFKMYLLVVEKIFLFWKLEIGKFVKDGFFYRVIGEEVFLIFI